MKKLPNKSNAIVLVGKAIKDGKLVRLSCEVCGDNKTHAHHTDYKKPLEVMWLCPKHHKEWHKKNGFPEGIKNYYALFVLKDTHHKIAGEAKLVGMTIDEFLLELIKLYESGKDNKRKN